MRAPVTLYEMRTTNMSLSLLDKLNKGGDILKWVAFAFFALAAFNGLCHLF